MSLTSRPTHPIASPTGARRGTSMASRIEAALRAGNRAMGNIARTDGDGHVKAVHRRIAGINDVLPMYDMLPSVFSSVPEQSQGVVLTSSAGEQSELSTALLKASRVVRAGCRLVPQVPTEEPRVFGGKAGDEPIVACRTSSFVVVGAAPFELGADSDENTVSDTAWSDLPVYVADVDLRSVNQYAFRLEIKRKDIQEKGLELISREAAASLARGIARAADRELLNAVKATTPGAFSFGAVATKDLQLSDLRGLVGTDGAAGKVGPDGQLRVITSSEASGPPAELTADMAGTLVGAWGHAALAIGDSISLLAQRTDASGRLFLTCWLDLQALVPDPGVFWSVT